MGLTPLVFAQQADELQFTLDVSGDTISLPAIFKPNVDLSGRGFHREKSWPQELAAKEAIATWQKEIGLSGFYRLQYNLWEINQLAKDKNAQQRLLDNYENIIKSVNDSGGTVILDIFGTPAGLGRILDKKSPPLDYVAFKAIVKNVMRQLSCNKRYNIWYEVWNAPDSDDFFLGRKQDYLYIYRAVAESAKELERETMIHIPVGGPSVSSWFQSTDANNILTPERSLIYELIRFCYKYHLPLNFISWHAYSTGSGQERESTIYKKAQINLIRDWLAYFHFDANTQLIIDEWNYDRSSNVLQERKEKSFIAASYIIPRIKNMYEEGIDNQIYFCLEDFQDNKEKVVRNVGVFYFEPSRAYKGGSKAAYNVFKMLSLLGKDLFINAASDDFSGILASKSEDGFVLLAYNYIDPEIAKDYLAKKIALLGGSERRFVLNIIKSGEIAKIMEHKQDIYALRTTKRVKELLKNGLELSDSAKKFLNTNRSLKLTIKNLKDAYSYERFSVDSSCSLDCDFKSIEQKDIPANADYSEALSLSPYSAQLVMLKKKPEPPKEIPKEIKTEQLKETKNAAEAEN